jgi:hypothetical protein
VHFDDFVLAELDPSPLRVAHSGGEQLARALAAAGYALTDEPPYQARVIEGWQSSWGSFTESIVRSADVLPASGLLVFEVVVPERLDSETVEWFHRAQRSAAEKGEWNYVLQAPEGARAWLERLSEGVPGELELARLLDKHFVQRSSGWQPVLHKHVPAVDVATERQLINTGTIKAVGFRYSGTRRS